MGEALITRRGGRSVKTGTITPESITKIKSDDLVGVKNAILRCDIGKLLGESGKYTSIEIVDGEIVAIWVLSGQRTGNLGVLEKVTENLNEKITFNSATGTITATGSTEAFLYSESYSDYNSNKPFPFNYYILD